MPNPLLNSCDNYVILGPGQPEKLLTSAKTLEWLEQWLKQIDRLPKDIQDQPSITDAAQRLLDTACDLEINPGFKLQWFAVRLDPSGY